MRTYPPIVYTLPQSIPHEPCLHGTQYLRTIASPFAFACIDARVIRRQGRPFALRDRWPQPIRLHRTHGESQLDNKLGLCPRTA